MTGFEFSPVHWCGSHQPKTRPVRPTLTSPRLTNFTTLSGGVTLTGGLTGRVLGNSLPLANAQVKIQSPSFSASTSTLSDGKFTLANIPVGNGYVLNVSAAGYNSTRLTGVNVLAGGNVLGDITLTSASGSYTLKEMPNVNPVITTVEQGGIAYRYYCVVNASGNQQGGIPGIPVSVQTADGIIIPQTDVSDWPGNRAGTSDNDQYGTVRIAVPASVLNQNGIIQTVQLSIAGQIQKSFQTQVISRKSDQVWRHQLGVGVSAPLPVPDVSIGGNVSAESEVRHNLAGATVTDESISRIDSFKITGSVGRGVDVGLSLQSSAQSFQYTAGASASAGVFAGPVLQTTYSFTDPSSSVASENAMKLYLDLGNLLTAGGTAAGDIGLAFYSYVSNNIEPSFLGANLQSVEGDFQIGGNIQVTGGIADFLDWSGQSTQVALGGGFSSKPPGFLALKRHLAAAGNRLSFLA